ncbi:hypothetical protein [Candidatus Poriferisodalis sp.]|uniref:hypothetical protein n=1 Tax=Candidatus Poriferisodalis sp. TaxID=3101277 RepID=UPI003AF759E7
MSRLRALSVLVALAVLSGCTGAEPTATSPAASQADTSRTSLLTATTAAPATSAAPTQTTALSAEPASTAPAPTERAPASADDADTVPATTAADVDTDDAQDSDPEGEDASDEQDLSRPPGAPSFSTGRTPEWPFTGLIQLWYSADDREPHWFVRYWHWPSTGNADSEVWLPGFETDCLGQTAVVVHGPDGIEVGTTDGTNPSTYWLAWSGGAHPTEQPTEQLTTEASTRASNIEARTEGDLLHLAVGEQSQTYSLREPVRPDGQRWIAQARHDGELLIITVHPAHLPCFSGVTWLSHAPTGELLGCGTSTHVVRFVSPTPTNHDSLVLPDQDALGTYLSCTPPLDFARVTLPSP